MPKRTSALILFICLLLCLLILITQDSVADTGGTGPAGAQASVGGRQKAGVGQTDEQDGLPFIRLDRDDPDAWKGKLHNLRILTGNLYKHGKVKSKYNIDPDFVPSDSGLSSLNISGSAQFSEPQFRELAETLRGCAPGKCVVVVDLRQESHGLSHGIPVSVYDLNNWANAGMSLEEIEKDEQECFGSLVGEVIRVYPGTDDGAAGTGIELSVEQFMTEKKLVENEGFGYYRLPIQDHTWPTAEQLDDFIAFVKELDQEVGPDGIWLHFHCQAGKGRTGIMMMVYDMMRNPQLPMEDILVRQTMLGGNYPLYTEQSDSYKVPLYEEKARMMPLFYEYVQQQNGCNYEVPWSEWLAHASRESGLSGN